MGGTSRHRAGPAGAIPAQREAMWMLGRGSGPVAEEVIGQPEDVVGELKPGAHTFS